MLFLLILLLGTLTLAASQWWVWAAGNGRVYGEVQTIPPRRVGLLLGCASHVARGRRNLFFIHRIQAAVALYQAGKVDLILASGDNHTRSYDETTAMQAALLAAGIPADRIVCDYAGFRTLDSVIRAHTVFGQSRITVISQESHNRRALFIARHHGIDAIGFNARDVGGAGGLRNRLREVPGRLKAVFDILFRIQPRFSGPPAPIPPENT